jgi:hypothetical protein
MAPFLETHDIRASVAHQGSPIDEKDLHLVVPLAVNAVYTY